MTLLLLLACGSPPPMPVTPGVTDDPGFDCASTAARQAQAAWGQARAAWGTPAAEPREYKVTLRGPTGERRIGLVDALDGDRITARAPPPEAGGTGKVLTGTAADLLDFVVLEGGDPVAGGFYTRCQVEHGQI